MAHESQTAHTGGAVEHHVPPTSVRQYVFMGIFLTVVTAIEFAMVEMDDVFGPILVPALMILTAAKFMVVVVWFMHLKWDPPLLRRLFSLGFVLASGLLIALLALFWLEHNGTLNILG